MSVIHTFLVRSVNRFCQHYCKHSKHNRHGQCGTAHKSHCKTFPCGDSSTWELSCLQVACHMVQSDPMERLLTLSQLSLRQKHPESTLLGTSIFRINTSFFFLLMLGLLGSQLAQCHCIYLQNLHTTLAKGQDSRAQLHAGIVYLRFRKAFGKVPPERL